MIRGAVSFSAGLVVALAAGWLAFPRAVYREIPQPVQFSHHVHADKAGMKCEDCHSLNAEGTFSGVPQADKCSGCHSAPMGNTAAEKILIERYLANNREVPWTVYGRQPANAFFPHAIHLKIGKLACEQCHREHGKTDGLRVAQVNRISGYGKNVISMSECEQCHREHAVKAACIDCHK